MKKSDCRTRPRLSTARTLTGTANEITVANGAGASGNPTISLPSALTFTGKTVTGGTFNDILSMTAHEAGSTANSIAATATVGQFFSGSSGSPTTHNNPTVSISRYDARHVSTGDLTGVPLYIDFVADQTSASSGLAPATGIMSRVVQNGVNDVLGMGVEVVGDINSGGGRFAYGYYANVWSKGSATAAYGMETHIFTDTGTSPYSTGATPYHVGAVYFAGGTYLNTAGIYFAPSAAAPSQWDVGIAFRAGAVKTASLWDDSSAITTLLDKGSHTNGIDLSAATYSGSAFKSSGFSVSNTGVVTAPAAILTQAGGALFLAGTNAAIEMGASASNTPLINFHSGATPTAYDTRIIASGGTGADGGGTLTVVATTFALPAVTTINGIQAVSISAAQTLTNKSMDGGSNTFTNIPGSAITGAALTKTDDTNVTLTLGGTPATALNRAASITVGWTGTLAPSRGGTGISSLGTGVATALGVNVGSAGAFVTFNGALGTPSSGTLSNCTGLPVSTGISGLGAGVAAFLATPSSANLASAIIDETGSGALVFGTSPTFTTQITTPVIIGGSSASQQLVIQSTSGSGTTDRITFKGGSNGATTFGEFNMGGGAPGFSISYGDFRSLGAGAAFGAIDRATQGHLLFLFRNAGTLALYDTEFGGNVVEFLGSSAAAKFFGSVTIASKGLSVGTTQAPADGQIYINSANFLMRNKTSWSNGAAANTGTLTNAPASGNPTKWIPIDDNGTTRYIPAW